MLDVLICLPFVYAAYKGFIRGLIIEVASLLSLIVGVYGAVKFSSKVGEYIIQFVDLSGTKLKLISFILTFILIVIAINLLAKMLEKIVNLVALKFINKLAGIVFGIIKMGIIVGIVLLIVSSIDAHLKFIPEKMKSTSYLYNPICTMTGSIIPAIKNAEWYPNEIEDSIEDTIDETEIDIP